MLSMFTDLYIYLQLNLTYATVLAVLSLILLIVIIAWIVNFLTKTYIVYLVRKALAKTGSSWGKTLVKFNVFQRLSQISPAIAIYILIPLINTGTHPWTNDFISVARTGVMAYIVLAFVWFLMSLLNAMGSYYKLKKLDHHPSIKGYLQLAKIIIWAAATILVISILLNKSPWIFLTGLGAISAVLMLVFKDTILGFVASVQVSTYDMIRVGDWITMPAFKVDGDVIDVSINTVKIRNFDKTVTTIPTYSLMINGVQNWRGMQETGGRRIKRAINFDIDTIKFCDKELIGTLSELKYLKEYIQNKEKEIEKYNTERCVNKALPIDGRSLTNIGLFRAYVESYLHHNEYISKDLTFLIRQLQPTQYGLPLELYIFTNDTNWVRYENIQSDIFDHLLAAVPMFELKVFQIMSGTITAKH
jgi:miniconductance mechanosensitive channel